MRTFTLLCLIALLLTACDTSHEPVIKSFHDIRNSEYSITVAATVLRQGNYGYAAMLANAALAEKQLDPPTRTFAEGILANAALHGGQYDKAAQALDAIASRERTPADNPAADAAVAAHPNRPEGYFIRARLTLAAGNYAQAISDCDVAIGLEIAAVRVTARDKAAWRNFAAHRFSEAIAGLGDNSMRAAAQPYTLLLLHLARAGAGRDDTAEMSRAVDAAGQTEWPAPILAFCLGRIDRNHLFAAADDGPTHEARQRQRCEANFYAGEEAALQGDETDARTFLKDARDDCPPRFDEADIAGAELARLHR